MKIIIPMAGRGKRLRPHTLTVPKPLIPIAGKPIVQRLVEDIVKACHREVDEIAFIIGDFREETEKALIEIAEKLGIKGSIYYQDKPLGTAHAILCSTPMLEGNIVVAFPDTLFRANFTPDSKFDGVIWTKKVKTPHAFGVVKKDRNGYIVDFIEKPAKFVSDEIIIGIYYFKDGAYLKSELQYLIDNDMKNKGEFQLTDALQNMKNKGSKFASDTVSEWMDCGNKNATIKTNGKILNLIKDEEQLVSDKATVENSEILGPCYIAEGVVIKNSKVGPSVSIGTNTKVINSTIDTTIIQENSKVLNARLTNSMIGNKALFNGKYLSVSIGDYSTME